MNAQQALIIFVRTFGYILEENEGIVTDDIDGTQYFVYCHEGEIEISKASDSSYKSKNYKNGKLIWFYKNKEECVEAQINDYITQKEIEKLTDFESGEVSPIE